MEMTEARVTPDRTVPITPAKGPAWKGLVAKYQTADTALSARQFSVSLAGFVALAILMVYSLNIGYWLTLLLVLPTAGFLTRLFIIQHDCGHGSFFRSRKLNDAVGLVCSLFTLTPYYYWQKSHSIHHAHAGNLEHRGIGDIYTMTVNEYVRHNWWGKLKYHLYRNPVILFIFAPTFMFVVLQRFPGYKNPAMRKVESSVWWTNVALALFYGAVAWLIGWQTLLMVASPVIFLAATAGTWMFYVQHQFEDTYWDHNESWDYSLAALEGSSYYKLPRILQWFTGNIGFHHIHHLSPRIPNYKLETCHNENPMFQNATVLTLTSGFKTVPLTLWDEERRELITFRQLKERQKLAAQTS